jgi:uroporphyrinogen decarboxylase
MRIWIEEVYMNSASPLFLRAIRKEAVDRTPLWMMRQAGRYLPEYRELRQKYDFLTVCKTPELAAEVTLQPLRRFGFDAAILFSDILVIPEALGQELRFAKNHGPLLNPVVRSAEDLATMSAEGIEEKLDYVAGAIQEINRHLDPQVPLIGFSGSPWTLAVYMIEGQGSKNFQNVKKMLYTDPELMHQLLDLLTDAVIRYVKMQVQAGVKALQIFDTWGGILPIPLFQEYSARYMQKIIDAVQSEDLPVTLFSKGGIALLEELKDSGAAMLGVDWGTDLARARSVAGANAALQGNLDPALLYGSKKVIAREVERCLQVFGAESGHVCNLGHGILPDIPVDNVAFFVDQVREISSRLHKSA